MSFETQIQAELANLKAQYADPATPRRDQVLLEIQKRQQAIAAVGGPGSPGGASEATLLQVLTALNSVSIDADSVNLNTDTLEGLITDCRDRLARLEALLRPPIAGRSNQFGLDVNPQTVLGQDPNRRKVWVFNNSPECTIYFGFDGMNPNPNRVEHHDVLAPMERKELLSPWSEIVFTAEHPGSVQPEGILAIVEYF